MALVSPGVEVTVVDDSAYPAASTATVPYILIATAENKINGAGTGSATGTLASAIGNTYLIASQRELVNTFGNPFFYKTSGGTPIHGYELNEYGLQAAYSVLGASNRAYVQRADIDLAQLTPTTVRPAGSPTNGTYWLDTAESQWGIFEWNSSTEAFTNKVPTVLTSTADLVGAVASGAPLTSVGSIGDYAVVAINASSPVYYKNRNNAWVQVGDNSNTTSTADLDWYDSHACVTSAVESTLTIVNGATIVINGTTVTNGGTALSDIVTAINTAAITGITAQVVSSKLEIYASPDAAKVTANEVSGTNFIIGREYEIKTVGTTDFTLVGANSNTVGETFIATGIGAGTGVAYDRVMLIVDNTGASMGGTHPTLTLRTSSHTQNPSWRATDFAVATVGRPTGSVWIKTTSVNLGANIVVKKYDTTTASWLLQTTALYEDDATANKALDATAGGSTIASGSTYGSYDVSDNDTATVKVMVRSGTGATEITGSLTTPAFVIGETFTVSSSDKGSNNMTTPVTITMTGTTGTTFVSDLTALASINVTASVLTTGAIKITHTQGGVIELKDTSGTPITDAGITTALDNVRDGNDTNLVLSNWEVLATKTGFSANTVAPGLDPTEGTKWYYSAIDEYDLMIHDGAGWKGYQNVTSDVRGYDLTATSPNGPIVSVTTPIEQSDKSALVHGDIWIDTSSLEEFPLIHRWQTVNTVAQWVALDTADQSTENGVLFADARWAANGTTDVISDEITTIKTLLTSDYLDLDAPSASLYPTGTILWNTRRSGYTVKEFKLNYFNALSFTGSLPTEKNTWVNASGLKDNGEANMGRLAQRSIVVSAMKSAIDTNTDIREEQRVFNLLATPGYPEIMVNMVALNNERNNTGFVVGDTPLRLQESGTELINWATNNSGAGLATGDGLNVNDNYLGVFYPSGKTTDLSGTAIVVPPSHAMLRAIIKSDDQSYPWLAPAGTRRGNIDNVSAIGYLDNEGEFAQTAVRQGSRDTLYENNVNPLTFIPGTGLVNYGNKTTKSGTALDRINVARLVAYIRSQVDSVAKQFLFEPNDKLTRDEMKGAIEKIMNDLIAKRGLYDYLVVCDESNNTPSRIDRSELYVDIAIEPVKAVEFIFIPIRIKNTGEIANGS
jgi:hypothetical protein